MLLVHWKTALVVALGAVACSQLGLGQVSTATILTVDLENQVEYIYDVADPLKFATDPGVTTRLSPKNFFNGVIVSDVVAVNGQPVKGTRIFREHAFLLRPTPASEQAVADIVANTVGDDMLQILKPDGTEIGTIIGAGLVGGGAGAPPPPPGAPLAGMANNVAILGGTGAFLGARGVISFAMSFARIRVASVTEDPSNRRNATAGKGQWVIYLIPMERPEIVTASGGPAVFHADSTPVTATKPAKAGEVLIVQATGLGPTVPGVNPGQPFPTDAILQVNSPVAVTVNGQAAEVVDSFGWPGLVDTYRVDLRVPDGATGGTAAIQLTAAWIAGASVSIPTQ